MATGEIISLDSSSATDKPDDSAGAPAGGKTPAEWHKHWDKEIEAAEKRRRTFLKNGNAIVKRFLDERDNASADSLYTSGFRGTQPSRLNLFHTNVTTMQAMLFGQAPKVEVAREHHDPDDDVARVASYLWQRMLEADAYSGDDDLTVTLQSALQDRLIPGIGQGRVRYSVTTKEEVQNFGEGLEPETIEVMESENVSCEYVHWQDYLWGWARTWSEVPWMAYRVWMEKDEVAERFGEKIAESLEYKNQEPSGSTKKDGGSSSDQKDNVQKAEIWEIWNEKDRRVYWFSSGASLILDSEDDPLGLEQFWPSPRPLIANVTTSLFMPRADFVLAQDLYNEIDDLQSRIHTITRAIKVVGVYDKNAGGSVGRMLKEGVENDLIPVDNWAMFAEKGGMQGVVDWFPVEEVVGTLQTLVSLRDQSIELLYQVTGMSDILRGANTQQYTSDGTQQLKAKFGSVRVQTLQDQFAKFASELDQLKAEVISLHFDETSIIQQSNAQFVPQADQQLVQPALQLMKSPGAKWRVTIRPESVAMVDYAQLKSERTEFLTAMATYIQSAQAAVKQIPGSLPVLLEMLKWGMAGFKGSNMLEGTMDLAIEAAKNAPPPGNEEQQAEQQAEQQRAMMEHRLEMEKIQTKANADMQVAQHKFQLQMQQETAKSRGDMQKIMADLQADLQIIAAKLNADIANEEAQAVAKNEEQAADHEYTMDEMEQAHEYATVEARQQNRETSTD